jgi:tetratricopeptide (TPR) repeat protein
MDDALLIAPNNSDYNSVKSCALCGVGKYDEAAHYADKAVILDPNSTLDWYMKGAVAEAKDDKTEAILDHQKSLSLDPNSGTSKDTLYRLEHP